MMFPSSSSATSRLSYRIIGLVTIAIAFIAILFIDTDEIFLLANFNSLSSSATHPSVCPECEGVFRPEYDYEADHTVWDKLYGKVESIRLLGERHSGTNWITDHLTDCFGQDLPVKVEYARFKHWFQIENSTRVPSKSSIVISMYRDPYDWVWAMKERPHHAHGKF